jgi:hypothetical protein
MLLLPALALSQVENLRDVMARVPGEITQESFE